MEKAQKNTVGFVGFIFALISVVLGIIPLPTFSNANVTNNVSSIAFIVGLLLSVFGLILSAVGLTKPKKGFAIIGLIISVIMLILTAIAVGFVIGIAAAIVASGVVIQ